MELIWANFKFVRDRDFERAFGIMARRNSSRPYGTYVKSLDLVHTDREFNLTPNVILLVTSLCPNLETISITFHNTRPVAPPAPLPIMQNRPVLPPIRRPGDAHPRPPVAAPVTQLQQQQSRSPPRHNHPPHLAAAAPPAAAPPACTSPNTNHHPTPRQHNHSLPLAHLAYNCKKIRTIRLTSYSPKTDDSVYEMAKYMKSGSLETIIFTGCGTLQGSTLCKLAMTNPQLRHIEIAGSTPVSDSSLATLAEKCGPNLESISIGNAYNLTDMSVRHVAKRCKNLKHLMLFNNADGNRLSEAALIELLQRCVHLRTISLSNARVLGERFFELAANRVEHELASIEHENGAYQSGLQRICLGSVQRQVIEGPSLARLIKMSASSSQNNSDDDDDDDETDDDLSNRTSAMADSTLSHLLGNAAHMPKTTVIRGSTIWWQRRRPRSR
ncbi:hypothetical protein BX666DRAFT_1877329 [Dichotomocladium elegans]|nr:hypothetical protein BX666DRAFT_1877329 [Dichotomocladium elegans]